MAFDFEKGMIAVATSYSGGKYHYEKLDPYIEASSLNITPDQMQDLDSYRNANGVLKRPGVMPYTASKIEANINHTDEKTLDKVMKMLKKGTHVEGGIPRENKVKIRFYNPKQMDYTHAWAYFADITYGVYGTYRGNGKAIYTPTRIAFITYGEKVVE